MGLLLREPRREEDKNNAHRVAITASTAKPVDTDPCAPHLWRDERLKRLATFGRVRETGMNTLQAGGHEVAFFGDGSLMNCE